MKLTCRSAAGRVPMASRIRSRTSGSSLYSRTVCVLIGRLLLGGPFTGGPFGDRTGRRLPGFLAVEHPVDPPRLLLGVLHPLHHEHRQHGHADYLAAGPEDAAGDLLVVERVCPGEPERRVPTAANE